MCCPGAERETPVTGSMQVGAGLVGSPAEALAGEPTGDHRGPLQLHESMKVVF